MKKSIFTILSFTAFLLVSCGGGGSEKKEEAPSKASATFVSECSACHGKSGNLKMGGAKDLTKSVLSQAEVEAIISDGKGMMPPFKDRFSPEQIKELAVYVKSLRK